MTLSALVMLVLSLTLVWGGLLLAVVNLRRHPSPYDDAHQDAGRAAAEPQP